jgi:fatty acid desaturase
VTETRQQRVVKPVANASMRFAYYLAALWAVLYFAFDWVPPDWLLFWPVTWYICGRLMRWMDAHDS